MTNRILKLTNAADEKPKKFAAIVRLFKAALNYELILSLVKEWAEIQHLKTVSRALDEVIRCANLEKKGRRLTGDSFLNAMTLADLRIADFTGPSPRRTRGAALRRTVSLYRSGATVELLTFPQDDSVTESLTRTDVLLLHTIKLLFEICDVHNENDVARMRELEASCGNTDIRAKDILTALTLQSEIAFDDLQDMRSIIPQSYRIDLPEFTSADVARVFDEWYFVWEPVTNSLAEWNHGLEYEAV